MDTLEFLQRVLPPEGFYCTIIINKGIPPQQAFFNTVEELATNCQTIDQRGNNVYFATSTFKTRFTRKQHNALLTKSLFIDIDCAPEKAEEGTGYLDQDAGIAALQEFLNKTGMPKPLIISSGRGLHVYWTLEEALPCEEWQPLADALKATFKIGRFLFDPAVTADCARVLRPVGTHNPKNGAEVRLMLDAPDYSKQTLQNILGAVKPTLVTDLGTAAPPATVREDKGFTSMAIDPDYPPAKTEKVLEKCEQVRWAVENQAKVPEPLWYAVMGVAAYCEDPEETAKDWSHKYPGYSEAETLNKIKQWKDNTTGPATCNKFLDARPDGCGECKLAAEITTPARLGVTYDTVAIDDDAPDTIANTIPVPWPYKITSKGVMVDDDGTFKPICDFQIYPVGYGLDESLGFETVRYKWKRPHMGWQDLVFRQAYLNAGGREFATATADQGVVLPNKKQLEGFQVMLRSYMDELRKMKSMTNIYGTMGWKDDFKQFVIGDRLYKREPDGSVVVEDISLTSASNIYGKGMYQHKGSLESWRDATSILESQDMPWHIFALNQTWAAPLWAMTGLKGMTVSLCGDSGGGKSIIQLWQQSVWGDPDKLHFAAKFTHNALFSRLGVYCNLPMTIDEATMMEDVGDFCYWVSQGRDKARLNRKAEEREAKEWATVVTVSTNISFAAKMAASGIETDAQMARLLEITIPAHRMFAKSSDAGRKIAHFLMDNHGIPGDVYAKELLRLGEVEVKRRIREATTKFRELYGCTFAGVERYWEQNLILQHVGGQIAMEAGIIAYDYRIGIQWLVDQLDVLRNAVIESRLDGINLVHEYLNDKASDAIVVMHTEGSVSAMDPSRIPLKDIKIRYDVYRDSMGSKFEHGTVMLVQRAFKTWLAARGYDYSTLKGEVSELGIDATPASKRVWIGRNTSIKAGQHSVLGINLNCKEMEGYLHDIELAVKDLTLGQLGIVT